MPITDAQIKARIIDRIGDIDPDTWDPTTAATGLLATTIDGVWDAYQDKKGWPRLREYYTERELIRKVQARIRNSVDTNTGQSIQLRLQVLWTNLKDIYAEAQTQIDYELKRQRASSPAVLTAMTTTSPRMPPQSRPLVIDPSDPYYGGDPFFPVPQWPV